MNGTRWFFKRFFSRSVFWKPYKNDILCTIEIVIYNWKEEWKVEEKVPKEKKMRYWERFLQFFSFFPYFTLFFHGFSVFWKEQKIADCCLVLSIYHGIGEAFFNITCVVKIAIMYFPILYINSPRTLFLVQLNFTKRIERTHYNFRSLILRFYKSSSSHVQRVKIVLWMQKLPHDQSRFLMNSMYNVMHWYVAVTPFNRSTM